jgi:hypothetical protein
MDESCWMSERDEYLGTVPSGGGGGDRGDGDSGGNEEDKWRIRAWMRHGLHLEVFK